MNTVTLDPLTVDADNRENRIVPLDMTIVVQLPKAFYDDHRSRGLIAGNVERETAKGYDVRMDEVVFDELISDADVFVSYGTAEMGASYMGLVASARAVLKRLHAVRNAPWMVA